MTTDIDLLPLPEGEASSFGNYKVHDDEAMIEYARANVAHATAPLQAEIEALLEERDALAAALVRMVAQYESEFDHEDTHKFRPEWLREALARTNALQEGGEEPEALRAEVDALRQNAASVQPELVAVALAACDAVDDLIEKWYATRESGCLPNQVVRARGASKLLRAIALEGTK